MKKGYLLTISNGEATRLASSAAYRNISSKAVPVFFRSPSLAVVGCVVGCKGKVNSTVGWQRVPLIVSRWEGCLQLYFQNEKWC